MNADYETVTWARHHGSVSRAIRTLLRTIDVGFTALNRREFDAPWRQRPRHRQA